MQNKKVYLCLAHMSEDKQEEKYVKEAFDTNWVVPLGPNVNAFEQELSRYYDGHPVCAVNAGTSAIHLGLKLLGVTSGDEVLIQTFTFCASANPTVYQGATPVFVDSEADTWNMSPELLETAIKDRIEKTRRKPKAIVTVCLYGMPSKMDEILSVARKYEIPVLEDSAEAMGSCYKGKRCGTLADYGVVSFNGNKMITTSGGGALICPDEKSRIRALKYATQAREPFLYYQHEELGYNYRLSNVCAGIGRGQMTVLEQHLEHHRHVLQLYTESFKGVEGITVHQNPSADFDSNFWLTAILLNEGKVEPLITALAKEGIESRPLWKPMHLQPLYAGVPAYIDGTAERLFRQGLCLPSGPCVSDEDVKRIVNKVNEILNECRR